MKIFILTKKLEKQLYFFTLTNVTFTHIARQRMERKGINWQILKNTKRKTAQKPICSTFILVLTQSQGKRKERLEEDLNLGKKPK